MEIQFTKKFSKIYSKSPKNVRKSFNSRLELFIKNPFDPLLNNHQLSEDYKNHRSINVNGDWRAIYIEDRKNKCIFVAMGTHSQLYK